jgi:signal peptidase
MKKLKELRDKIANNKPLNIVLSIIKFIIYAFLVLLLITIFVQKISQNKKTIGGFMIFTVASGSMSGEYEIGDIIVTKTVPEEELKVGDNITYISRANGYDNITEGMVITHKLISIDEERGVKKYTTQGIVNPIPDVPITFDQIYGKVVYKTAILSYIGRIINNKYVYYISFIVIGLIVSIEVVAAIFESKREDDDADE